MNDIKELLKASIEETIEQVYSDEVIRQCKMAWNRGFQFGLLIGGIISILAIVLVFTLR